MNNDKTNKDKGIGLRVTEEERNRLKEKADKLDMSVSEYLRFVGLYSEVEIKVKYDKND